MQKLSFDCIGTHLELEIDSDQDFSLLFASIEKRISHFEEKYSRFLPGNWLDTLNASREAELDADGKRMLEVALEVARSTDGYFDPTVTTLLSNLGYGRAEHRREALGYQHIEHQGDRVHLHDEILLEFGGVGKGYLIDVIRQMVDDFSRVSGLKYCINFGGDLYAQGGYTIGLENPHNFEEVIGTIILDGHYLACSSPSRRKWEGGHHLVDPKTKTSAREVAATFIEGPSGILTDAYATAFSVMPFLEAARMLFDSPVLSGVILASDGRCFRSPSSRSELFTPEG